MYTKNTSHPIATPYLIGKQTNATYASGDPNISSFNATKDFSGLPQNKQSYIQLSAVALTIAMKSIKF